MPAFDLESAMAATTAHSVAVAYEVYHVGEDQEGEVDGEAERGWLHPPEDPVWVEPDAFDLAEGHDAVYLAVDYLRGEGATDASASHFHSGVWYIRPGEMDREGLVEQNTYHLKGFTEEEELSVFRRLTGNHRR